MSLERIEVHAYEPPKAQLIVVGIPTLGMVHIQLAYSLMSLRHPLNTKVHFYSAIGKSTAEGRNEIVARALKIGASHVFFIDDDTWPPPNALLMLLDRHRPIVSGLYFAKTPVPQPLVLHGKYAGAATSWEPGDLVECYGHGMGCTLIETGVFAALLDAGAVEYVGTKCPACGGAGCPGCKGSGQGVRWFYTTDQMVLGPDGYPTAMTQTEDVYFLERAAALGYQPAVDTGVFAWHFDHKTGRVYPLTQYEEYGAKGTVTWQTDHGPVTWQGVSPR